MSQAIRSTVGTVETTSLRRTESVAAPKAASGPVRLGIMVLGSFVAQCLARVDLPRQPDGMESRNGLPLVFIGNHRSLFDVVLGMRMMRRWKLPARMMVKADFFEKRFAGFLLRSLGAIPVSSGRGAKRAFDQAADVLRLGESIIIMPEAKIIPAHERPFGTAELVSTLGRLVALGPCMVVVTGLIGADDVWPVGARLPRIRPWARPSVRIRSFVLSDMHRLPPKEITAQLQVELRGIVNRMESPKQPVALGASHA